MRYFTSDCSSYEGMDEDTIIRLRSELGRPTTFIDEDAYNLLIQQLQENR